jgi:thiol-disulfide isomerase/thioredoxin/sugar lactone lactonase YvrE
MASPIHAPELDGGIAWLNTDRPLSLREMRGSVVILDFWTYCCINCMHVLPTLRAIEERHRNEPVVVIGVHSGKFDAEREPLRITEAVQRYDVRHPVVVDDDMDIWSRYGVRSWPTLVIIRPDGTIAAIAPGEPELEVLDAFIGKQLDEARQKGILAAAPPQIHAPPSAPASPVRYPGKVSILPDRRLVISDSGHHRLLLCSPEGRVELTIGSGFRGLGDGPVAEAAFDDPQGACFYDGALYIADTRNHSIRRVDLDRKAVTTVAGTGELGHVAPVDRIPGKQIALRSPWDLVCVGKVIYVAMAGSHQIWRFFPSTGEIEVFAGSGVEALVDGNLEESAFAQPSGLSYEGGTLYVADSEASSVRAIDLDKEVVRTLVGKGLFDFGDIDGPGTEARLQHALGVAALPGGAVLVADTYNGKVKRIEARAPGTPVTTLFDGLQEPGGLAVTPDGAWIVADTNAHRVVRIENGVITTLSCNDAPEPRRGSFASGGPGSSKRTGPIGWFTTLLSLPEGVGLGPGEGTIELTLHTEPGVELSLGSPLRAALEVSRRSDVLILPQSEIRLESRGGPKAVVQIPVRVGPLSVDVVEAEIVTQIHFVGCDAKDHAACVPGRVHARVPVRLLRQGGVSGLSFKVPLPALDV